MILSSVAPEKHQHLVCCVYSEVTISKNTISKLPNNPIENGIYLFNNEYYIYYKDQWYIFDIHNEIVKCPVEAFVNYYCEVMEGEYYE